MEPLDITTLQQAGFTAWEPTGIWYLTNPRNAFKYYIIFEDMKFSFSGRYMSGVFRVILFAKQNGEWRNLISYQFDSIANDTTYVDKFGIIVDAEDPTMWGTEFNRMQVLFNAPIKDSDIVESYQQDLFDRGFFDFPKN